MRSDRELLLEILRNQGELAHCLHLLNMNERSNQRAEALSAEILADWHEEVTPNDGLEKP